MSDVRSEPFVGWKGLLADSAGSLYSPQQGTPWPVGEYLFAQCTHDPNHVPPVTTCGCGIYACKTFEDLKDKSYNWGPPEAGKVWVIARLAMVGRVRPGRIGYRAEAAVVTKVLVSPMHLRLGAAIKERYGCKLGTIDRFSGRRN